MLNYNEVYLLQEYCTRNISDKNIVKEYKYLNIQYWYSYRQI